MSQIVKHKRSNGTITTGDIVLPKQPTPAQLTDGELAINYSNGHETLFTKNDSGEVVSFSNDAVLLSAIQECENVIESVSLNGNPLPVTNKNVNVTALTEAYDGLDSSATTIALAANQGRVLKEYIDSNFVKLPVVLYETDGTTGLLGVNNNELGYNWQLENQDFTPYKFLRCYIKEADMSVSSNALTPSMVIDLPLDTASLAKSANDSTSISPKTPCDIYVAGAASCNPSDQNRVFNVLVAVDITKTKFQVVCENSLYGTAQTNRNTDGRYCYKIEGYYNFANGNSAPSKTPYVTSTPGASVTIDPYKMYDFGTVARSMTIGFNTSAEANGYTKEYTIRFVAGNGCAITLPNGVLYANHITPTYTAGRTYEINVVNNCVVVAEFY